VKVVQEFMAKKTDAVEIAVKLAAVTGTKLPEIDVQDFRRSGYLPEALLNFVALVGWSPGGDREIMSMVEMLELFSLEGIQKTPGRFDRKKLAWMNGEYIRKSSIERLVEAVKSFNAVTDYPLKGASEGVLRELLGMYQERMVTLGEMAENCRFFFEEPVMDGKALEKFVKNNNGIELLRASLELLKGVRDWTKAGLQEAHDRILDLGFSVSGKRGAAAQPIRVAVSGNAITPPLLETLVLLGREKVIGRMERLLE